MAYTPPQQDILNYQPSDGSYREAVLKSLGTSENSSNTISAANGSFIVNDTVDKVIDSSAIVVLEDTIFTSIKVLTIDQKATIIADTAIAVKAGAILRPTTGVFSSVQLVSGSVALVL